MRILITGGEGQLGHELYRIFQGNDLVSLNHKEGDITQPEIIKKIEKINPELVIHAAAYTDVDGCEINPDRAYWVNALGTRNVVLGAQRVNADLVYISTDYVFDGQKGLPYTEFDDPNPLNIYGASKLAGEAEVKHLTNRFYIVRSSWLYGLEGKNFVKTILRLAKEEETLRVVDDQIGSPTFVKDLAATIMDLIQTKMYGTYHAAAQGNCSWFDFAYEILKFSKIQKKILSISSGELNRPAKRPSYSVLRNACLENVKITVRDWKDQVHEFLVKISMK